jgi:hypothetical protein
MTSKLLDAFNFSRGHVVLFATLQLKIKALVLELAVLLQFLHNTTRM